MILYRLALSDDVWPAAYRKVMFFSHGFKRGLWSLQPKDGGMKRVLFWMRGSVEWNVNGKKKSCVCEHSTYLSNKSGTGCNSIEVSLSPLNACEMQPLTTFLTSKAVKSDTVLTSTTLFLTDFSTCHDSSSSEEKRVCLHRCLLRRHRLRATHRATRSGWSTQSALGCSEPQQRCRLKTSVQNFAAQLRPAPRTIGAPIPLGQHATRTTAVAMSARRRTARHVLDG